MRISDWSSDVCSSDLAAPQPTPFVRSARETAKARRVDHLFATEAPQPQRTEAPAEPARPRDPAVVEGETRFRELLRAMRGSPARTRPRPQPPSYEPSTPKMCLNSQRNGRTPFWGLGKRL